MDLEHGSSKKPSAAPPPPAAAAAAATPTACNCDKLPRLGDNRLAAARAAMPPTTCNKLPAVVLRAAAAVAAVVAAAVMGLNAQSYTAVVAIVGTRPLTQTFTAKFRDTPAFV